MIYIDSDTNSIKFPKNSPKIPTNLEVYFRNTLTKNEVLVDVISFNIDDLLYEVEIEKLNIPVGEYIYYINENGRILEKGLLVFGDYKRDDIKSYNTENKKIQYNR